MEDEVLSVLVLLVLRDRTVLDLSDRGLASGVFCTVSSAAFSLPLGACLRSTPTPSVGVSPPSSIMLEGLPLPLPLPPLLLGLLRFHRADAPP